MTKLPPTARSHLPRTISTAPNPAQSHPTKEAASSQPSQLQSHPLDGGVWHRECKL
ncbi:hypothetical protein F7734_20945 [Scytonema sp. UIC 10036]|uniref:hypothetical protein n=1 Tax=Scytonema sp. UIC 10036 TaxID=2304196 RepID=UPI0012DAB5B1|nr:hypothetical protein [Scytonema sp. UIC 10036]MUG94695.1 hypothetical protein [Scytonema sp. UIC 10036]